MSFSIPMILCIHLKLSHSCEIMAIISFCIYHRYWEQILNNPKIDNYATIVSFPQKTLTCLQITIVILCIGGASKQIPWKFSKHWKLIKSIIISRNKNNSITYQRVSKNSQRLLMNYYLLNFRAEGSNILLEPNTVCKKSRQLPAKIADICKNETSLLKEITRGISKGFRECEAQFKNRRWNCSTQKKSMRKILARGEC